VHFVGESTGGTVGIHMAAHHPEKLASITTVSAAHRGGAIQRSRALRDDVERLGMDAWSQTLMPLRFHPGAVTEPMWRWFEGVQRNAAPHACADLVDMLVSVDLTAALPGIGMPMLILAPDDSPFVAVEQQVERLRAVPGSELQVIAGARHGLAHSHGPQCARVLRDFISRRVRP
jgi:3-oxoadipate enol-lactonase/4-carboxymuconolactone decarboxylase